MRLSTGIKLAIGLWLVAETLVFVLVAEVIGVPEALLVAFISSLFGWTLLKRAGTSAMLKLRALLEGRFADREAPRLFDDGLATAGAVALLVPGFLSDAVGLALAVPAARNWLGRWIGRRTSFEARMGGTGGRAGGPSTIDLEPGDWERTETPGRVPKA